MEQKMDKETIETINKLRETFESYSKKLEKQNEKLMEALKKAEEENEKLTERLIRISPTIPPVGKKDDSGTIKRAWEPIIQDYYTKQWVTTDNTGPVTFGKLGGNSN
jgi:predicted ribosome quality control (RQC) complex YloA/Tae2 family protein